MIINSSFVHTQHDPRKNDPTRIDPDHGVDPSKNDPTRINPGTNDPRKNDPTRIEPNKPAPQPDIPVPQTPKPEGRPFYINL